MNDLKKKAQRKAVKRRTPKSVTAAGEDDVVYVHLVEPGNRRIEVRRSELTKSLRAELDRLGEFDYEGKGE